MLVREEGVLEILIPFKVMLCLTEFKIFKEVVHSKVAAEEQRKQKKKKDFWHADNEILAYKKFPPEC